MNGLLNELPLSGGTGGTLPNVRIEPDSETGVLEFDVSSLLSHLDDPSTLSNASLKIRGSATGNASMSALRLPGDMIGLPGSGGRDDLVIFTASTDTGGRDLYVTDGTSEGTRLLFDTQVGRNSLNLSRFTHFGDVIFFEATEFSGELPLPSRFFVTDGKETKEVNNPEALRLQRADGLVEHGGSLYFRSLDMDSFQSHLVRISGTGTMATLSSVRARFEPAPVASTSAGLYLAHGKELWITDGTDAGTKLVTDVGGVINSTEVATHGTEIVFPVFLDDGSHSVQASDGTAEGTRVIQLFADGVDNQPTKFIGIDDGVYFYQRFDLYRFDGSVVKLLRTVPLPKSPFVSNIFDVHEVEGLHVSVANNGNAEVIFTTTNEDGGDVASASIGSGHEVFLEDVVVTTDGLLLFGYGFQGRPGGPVELTLATYDPSTGAIEVRESKTKEDIAEVGFSKFAVAGDLIVHEGFREDRVLGGQLWRSDLAKSQFEPIQTSGGSGGAGPVRLRFAGARNDGLVTGDELDETVVLTKSIQFGSTTSVQTVDLSDDIEVFRQLFASGYRSLVVLLDINEGSATVEQSSFDENTGLFFMRTAGPSGRLIDGRGRLVADEFNNLDLRNLPVGEYFLRVSRPADVTMDLDYTVHLNPPRLGDAHELSEDDHLRGGEGSDVIVGGPGKDRLYGGSGNDALLGEGFEFRDRNGNDVTPGDLATNRYASTRSPRQVRDPELVIGVSPDKLRSGEISLPNATIAAAIGQALGIPTTTRQDETVEFAETIRASDLAGISELDLSGLDLTDLDGLEHLIGLVSLDLSRNLLESSDLDPLRPASANTRGMLNLLHLNLDRNDIESLGRLSELTTLRTLSLADQRQRGIANVAPIAALKGLRYLNVSGNRVTDLSPLSRLSELRILDASGEEFSQQSIPQVDIRTLVGSQAFDASIVDADEGWVAHESPLSTGGSYLSVDARREGGDAKAVWNVPAGVLTNRVRYEVYATWNGDVSHTSSAVYAIDDQTIGIADQRRASSGRGFGSRQMQRVGILDSDGRGFSVSVASSLADGVVIADAIVFRPVEGSVADKLVHLDLRGTRLSESERDLILGELQSRNGVVHVDENESPRYVGPAGMVVASGSGRTIANLPDLFQDDRLGTLTFRVRASDPAVALFIEEDVVKLEADPSAERLVFIEIAATDAQGATTTVNLPLAIGGNLAQGRVTDLNGRPIEGLVLQTTKSGGTYAVTDSEGRYSLFVPLGDSQMEVAPGQNVADVQSPSLAIQAGSLKPVFNIDLTVTPGVEVSGPTEAIQGDTVELSASGNGSFQWAVTGGPIQVGDRSSSDFAFKPLQAGLYQVSVTRTTGGEEFAESVLISVADVIGTVVLEEEISVPEGPFSIQRVLTNDPGVDRYHVQIDYGNGTIQELPDYRGEEIELTTSYPNAGVFVLTVQATDVSGNVTSDSMVVTVEETTPMIAMDQDEEFEADQAGSFQIRISDPAGTISRETWSASIDWGDGSDVEDITPHLMITNDGFSADRFAFHLYPEGTYTATLRVVDNDGEVFETQRVVTSLNDVPELIIRGDKNLIEETSADFSVEVIDDDEIDSLRWDFGDGSAIRFGATVNHVYSRGGNYRISVTATDVDGLSRTRSLDVTVAAVNDVPALQPIEPITITETFAFSTSVIAVDEEGDRLSYHVENAPAGLSISDSGEIHWTPTSDQGPSRYLFDVVVDDGRSSSRTPVWVTVVDTGRIRGQLFEDANANGLFDEGESPLSGQVVDLDVGNDGTLQVSVTTDDDGAF
ncbi:MAG: PKD domain-containing protein, partial [Planctomycetota bacterium]